MDKIKERLFSDYNLIEYKNNLILFKPIDNMRRSIIEFMNYYK
jgi:hypothetical protein